MKSKETSNEQKSIDRLLDVNTVQNYIRSLILTHLNKDGVMENAVEHFTFVKEFQEFF